MSRPPGVRYASWGASPFLTPMPLLVWGLFFRFSPTYPPRLEKVPHSRRLELLRFNSRQLHGSPPFIIAMSGGFSYFAGHVVFSDMLHSVTL